MIIRIRLVPKSNLGTTRHMKSLTRQYSDPDDKDCETWVRISLSENDDTWVPIIQSENDDTWVCISQSEDIIVNDFDVNDDADFNEARKHSAMTTNGSSHSTQVNNSMPLGFVGYVQNRSVKLNPNAPPFITYINYNHH